MRTRRFVVFAHWVEAPICQRCFELPGEPADGRWEDGAAVSIGASREEVSAHAPAVEKGVTTD